MHYSDRKRLWQSLEDMAAIGPGKQGGSSRLALSQADTAGRRLLMQWGEAIGLSAATDAAGNLFLRRPGRDNTLPPLVMGSHLDTQPQGGRFDGVYGVLSGLEVLRYLDEQQIETLHPFELAVWTNEEGARFTPAMMGSSVFCGRLSLKDMYAATDRDGISVKAALEESGQCGTLPLGRPFAAYYEAHIEQGPILEAAGNSIGIVSGGQGILWLDAEIYGRAAHAGTTPMAMRRDSLIGSAKIITALEKQITERFPGSLITFGELDISAPSRNTIPGEVRFSIDLRHPDDSVLQKMAIAVADLVRQQAELDKLSAKLETLWHSPPVPFDSYLISTVRQAATQLGYTAQDIISGAGHDAILLAGHCPATMIFIPCEGGLSHNEAENISPDDAGNGADVLLNAVLTADTALTTQPSR